MIESWFRVGSNRARSVGVGFEKPEVNGPFFNGDLPLA
jgi:hypothetical protein